MNKETFEKTIQDMLRNPEPAATKAWLQYSEELEQDGICDAADFRRVMCQELMALRKDFGPEITEQLYNGGKEFTWNPFELRGAAGFLKQGFTIAETSEKVLAGLCDGDGPVPKRSKKQRKHETTL